MAQNSIENFSSYKFFWAELKATKGILTVHDAMAIGMLISRVNGRGYIFCKDKDSLISQIKSIDSRRLDKQYEVRIFTDAQLGRCPRLSNVPKNGGHGVNFTAKQNAEMFII